MALQFMTVLSVTVAMEPPIKCPLSDRYLRGAAGTLLCV